MLPLHCLIRQQFPRLPARKSASFATVLPLVILPAVGHDDGSDDGTNQDKQANDGGRDDDEP